MGQAFLITLREGLEGVLIVAIVMAYLRQIGRTDQFPPVLAGALAGAGGARPAGGGRGSPGARRGQVDRALAGGAVSMAMDLLEAGADRAVIALWLGHESVEIDASAADA